MAKKKAFGFCAFLREAGKKGEKKRETEGRVRKERHRRVRERKKKEIDKERERERQVISSCAAKSGHAMRHSSSQVNSQRS